MKLTHVLTAGFPLWVLAASIISLIHPPVFTWFTGPLITIGLGIIMLGMGVTLTVDDFRRIARFPGRVITGVVLQYTIMPFLGWSIAALMDLPTPFAVGLIAAGRVKVRGQRVYIDGEENMDWSRALQGEIS